MRDNEDIFSFLQMSEADGLASAKAMLREDGAALPIVRAALHLRDAGQTSYAKNILRLLTVERPGSAIALYELAFLERLEGNHRQSALLLARAIENDPHSFRSQIFQAHMLYACGAHQEADTLLSYATIANPEHQQAVTHLIEFGRYIRRNPQDETLSGRDMLLSQNVMLDHDQVADEILRALALGKPYALVRFGDGEGGVMQMDADDEARHRSLYAQNRQELISMWFGDAFNWRQNDFLKLCARLIEATSDCDVLGIPYEAWIEHEYRISSTRGIPSLANMFRTLLAKGYRGRRLASQQVHLDLMQSGRLGEIIAKAGHISIITCLDLLPGALKAKFGLEEVVLYRIPGERGSRHILGEKSIDGVHYPDRFQQLQTELARPHNGRLFLIAGGILGKFYAVTIRRYGGIAVDIGSVADGWAGYATRPGYSPHHVIV